MIDEPSPGKKGAADFSRKPIDIPRIIVALAVLLPLGCGVLAVWYGLYLLTMTALVLAVLIWIACRSVKGKPIERPTPPRSEPISECDPLTLHQAKMKYAWDWFQYHADQRFKAFHFFLIVVAFLAAAYGAAMKERIEMSASVRAEACATPADATLASLYLFFAGCVAFCGAATAIAFLLIEIRNTELVNCGRRWLDALEGGLGMDLREIDAQRICLSHAVGSWGSVLLCFHDIVRHQSSMRAIYWLAFFGFVGALAYALSIEMKGG